jgi:hypothetical protein
MNWLVMSCTNLLNIGLQKVRRLAVSFCKKLPLLSLVARTETNTSHTLRNSALCWVLRVVSVDLAVKSFNR